MKVSVLGLIFSLILGAVQFSAQERPRLREFGIKTGILQPGPLNAITDVTGVKVGQVTLIEGENIRTGVTAILPHEGNIFQEKVPAAVYVANGFGKITGTTQIEELGNLETPVVLTNTLSVPTAADALIDYILSLPQNERVESVNPVVGETNDGWLNDIRGRHVKKEYVLEAIQNATTGPVEEGAVGAGTGTICFNYKGGIGTSSRRLAAQRGGFTVGVLVQTNHGGVFQINGVPIDRSRDQAPTTTAPEGTIDRDAATEGSCMIVVATDAPLDSRNLKRLAKRALLGIARTGGYYSGSSGDYAIAFSTAKEVRIPHRAAGPAQTVTLLRNEQMSQLFLAAAEAAEEAILNSLFKAVTTKGKDGRTAQALPLEKIKEMIKKDGLLIGR